MKRRVVGLSLCVMLGVAPVARAGYEIASWTVDSGGGTSTGAVYRLDGTAGQPDAGIAQRQPFGQAGGFWGRVTVAVQAVFRIGTVFGVR
jgi:hypothetical protein